MSKTTRTTFSTTAHGTVAVTRDGVTTEYGAPAAGGYVREMRTGAQQYKQGGNGATLVWDPKKGSLLDLMRSEHRKAQREERAWRRAG